MLLAGAKPFGIDEPSEFDPWRFGHGDHLLVWAWRRIAAGRSDCPVLSRAFAESCGEDGAEVLATLATFLQILARANDRRLAIGPPCGLAPTADERRMLTLVAAAQNGCAVVFEAHLERLARPEARPGLAICAQALACAFGVHALYLPLAPPPPRARRQEQQGAGAWS